ncbi:MAG: NAD(P)/FAD-dependent oxidoreductase [Candidatus Pacearchaeota archaeon]
MEKRPKIVVVGSGFGGLETALSLNKKLGRKAEIKVLDKSDCCLYTPELYHYLIGERKKEDITFDLEEMLSQKGVEFKQEGLESIDSRNKKAKTDKGFHEYDYLVLSIGAEINTLGIKGTENAVGFKTIGHANKIKEKLDNFGSKNKINIIGCGLISVELACFLKKCFKKSEAPKIHLRGIELMPGFSDKVKEKVKHHLKDRDIEVIEDCKIEEIKPKKLKCKIKNAHKAVDSDLTIMSTGFKIPEVAKSLGLEYNEQGIKVNEFLETSEIGIFAIGDCSFLKQEGGVEKKRAQTAEKEGKHVAKNIIKDIKDKEKSDYKVEEIPTIISTAPTYILDYKGIVFKSKLVNLMEKFIKWKSMFR